MTGALIILAVTAAIGLALYLADRLYYRHRKTDEDTPAEAAANEEEETADGECCGMHIVCEKETLSPFTTEAEYFDDEELDEYRGTAADAYTPEQAELFRDILMTMRPEEVSAWVRSLTIRGIELPTAVRDEVLLIVSEARRK
ncbi:MAG TPA: phospholipase [Porphyromonadaceae bacterium]|nr:phospholipase [Porphyromonadaceae bacterium]